MSLFERLSKFDGTRGCILNIATGEVKQNGEPKLKKIVSNDNAPVPKTDRDLLVLLQDESTKRIGIVKTIVREVEDGSNVEYSFRVSTKGLVDLAVSAGLVSALATNAKKDEKAKRPERPERPELTEALAK